MSFKSSQVPADVAEITTVYRQGCLVVLNQLCNQLRDGKLNDTFNIGLIQIHITAENAAFITATCSVMVPFSEISSTDLHRNKVSLMLPVK